MIWRKILIINLFLLILVFAVTEVLNYNTYKSKYMDMLVLQAQNNDDPQKALKESLPKYKLPKEYDFKKYRDKDKFIIKGSSDKRPIITIGCSYTYGILLEPYETLAGQLNRVTDRTVYNLGISATGPQTVYEQLKDPDIKKEIPDAEYIIYTFLHNHIMRQFMYILSNSSIINPVYEVDENNNLVKRKPFFPKILYMFFTVRNYLEQKMNTDEQNELGKGLPLFLRTMKECVKTAKEKYPDSKFVLLEFPQGPMCRPDYQEKTQELTEENIKNLEKIGIIYINAEELAGHKFRDTVKYRIADKDHPNSAVWEELAPLLKSRLNL